MPEIDAGKFGERDKAMFGAETIFLFCAVQTELFHLIELRRGSRGFGFSIRGGKEFDGMPLYILKIADDGPAQLDGRLQVILL